ncbi:sodium-dependent transporter [Halomonas sp. 25-S5]|uniref:sodium-dependent transporter n=1 Tax=Halomonas sp. 25-S5 TaxID=2994065 RepID=UPI002469A9F7|nr:sodium-dependent transporter [Halomonas sp. 25-S5]
MAIQEQVNVNVESNGRSANWSSRVTFILAAGGAAVGLGNIWKFPYIVGENGGAAFIAVYLVCIAIVGIPVMIAEITIGRMGRQNPVKSISNICKNYGISKNWKVLGFVCVLASFTILSFYSVVGGWVLHYVVLTMSQSFSGLDQAGVEGAFSDLVSSPSLLLFWHFVFMGATMMIVSRGIKGGIEKVVTFCMPTLFAILVILAVYSATTDGFREAISYLFNPDFEELTSEGVIVALGHAFFTLGLGMGTMIAYGAYLDKDVSIVRVSCLVALLDTIVALLAGLAIFPVIFSNNMPPESGTGLIFQALPLAFSNMPFGSYFGILFFLLLTMAALTSSISVLEPVVQYLEEKYELARRRATLIAGGACWAVGVFSAFSLNLLSDFHPMTFITAFEDKTIMGVLEFVSSNIMLPLSGLISAIFVGWVITKKVGRDNSFGSGTVGSFLVATTKYITPLAILVVFASSVL